MDGVCYIIDAEKYYLERLTPCVQFWTGDIGRAVRFTPERARRAQRVAAALRTQGQNVAVVKRRVGGDGNGQGQSSQGPVGAV